MVNDNAHVEKAKDAISHAGTCSKVSSKNPKNRRLWYLGLIVMVAITGTYMLNGSSNTDTRELPQTSQMRADYQTALDENLARLKNEASKVNQTYTPVNIQSPPQSYSRMAFTTPKVNSKEYLARQNAPTSMYENSNVGQSQIASYQSNSNSPQSVTLAGQGANAQFANSSVSTSTVSAKAIAHPETTLASGEFLHGVLETAINSDLPGMVRAVVSTPAYSYTGEDVIIPAGSRLIGQYSSSIVQGQNRVMVIWNRIILPDGTTAQLNSPGTDSLGQAGQGANKVNNHFMARFGESALLSLIGAGAANAGVNSNDEYNSAAQYRSAISQSFQQSAQQSLQGSLPIKPTLHIYQGAKINVFVAHDVSFYGVLKGSSTNQAMLPSFVK